MKYRKLRIAWSVAWGVVAVLLCVLWVRSQRWADIVFGIVGRSTYSVTSFEGAITASLDTLVPRNSSFVEIESMNAENSPLGRDGLRIIVKMDGGVAAPVWLILLLAIATAVLPQIQWSKRFSLRTLLIATTLVALGLGAIVWITK